MEADRLPFIVSFDETVPAHEDERVALLGGKGANLIEMRQRLGLRVPPGFVLTTRACRQYLDAGWSTDIDGLVAAKLAEVERHVDRRFGGFEHPLLVSVRSGAPRSMPGMLDTVLNVGINETVADALAEESQDRAFADGTWLRFTRMFAETVLGIEPSLVAAAASVDDKRGAIDAVRKLANGHGGIPDDPAEQLRQSIAAVFRSWMGDRAVAFRDHEGIDEAMGTACTIQAMVYGNLNDRSGTGVAFTRDPSTGESVLYGNYLARAQGEDVVSGAVDVSPIAALAEKHPDVYEELRVAADRLERHYRDLCDIEFTVADGTLYLLQTRVGRRSPRAAVVIAVDMASDPEFPLTTEEAVERVSADQIDSLRRLRTVRDDAEAVAAGTGASPGVATGVVAIDVDNAIDLARAGADVVLVREATSPADVRAIMASVGIVTCVGGVGSHAAVVARGWGIPAVVGCGSVTIGADRVTFGDTSVAVGATITLDGSTGLIYLDDQSVDAATPDTALARLETWRSELNAVAPEPLGAEANQQQARADLDDGDRESRSTPLAVVRVVQFKGMATIDTIASCLAIPPQTVNSIVASLGDDVLSGTALGLALTPAGREWLTAALGAEHDAAVAAAMAADYARFSVINLEFKTAITTWQTSAQDDTAFAALLDELDTIHDRVRPIMDHAITHMARLGRFPYRLDAALEKVRAGDRTMIASPLADSYHTVWFEFHEELMHLAGVDRLAEERGETADPT